MHDRLDAILIRRAADNELSAEERASFDARMAADPVFAAAARDAMAFEASLRTGCEQILRPITAPAELVNRVQAAMASATADQVGSGQTEEATPELRLAPAATSNSVPAASPEGEISGWRRLFTGPQRPSLLAVAASLLVIAGVVAWSMVASPIDGIASGGNGLVQNTSLEAAMDYAAREHGQCTCPDHRKGLPGRVEQRQAAEDLLRRRLGADNVQLPDLSEAGYEFECIAECSLPGCDLPSVRVLYRESGEPRDKARLVSLIVTPDHERFDGSKASDRAQRAVKIGGDDPQGPCSREVMKFSDSGLAWFVVCCNPRIQNRVHDLIAGR